MALLVALERFRVEVRRVLGRLLKAAEVELAEVFDGVVEALLEGDLGLPLEVLSRLGDVGLALLGVVAGQRQVDDLRLGADLLDAQLRQLLDRELARVADVHRPDGVLSRRGGRGRVGAAGHPTRRTPLPVRRLGPRPGSTPPGSSAG